MMDDMRSKSPKEIGTRIAEELLTRPEFMFYCVGDVRSPHYAEACAGFGALRLAGLLGDGELASRIRTRYDIELAPAEEPGKVANTANHVDANVYGILPLEIFIQTKDRAFLDQGMALADSQWLDPLPSGMTKQTRFWIDDMYMITCLQVQAFNATGQGKYLERAALEIDAYLKKLQRPNGLFYHGENARFLWGRGNGWAAAGLAELLTALPRANTHYASIKDSYVRMMRALKGYQCEDGMWRQLIDREEAWKETSASAMFGYALCVGVKKGVLPDREYRDVYEKAWTALTGYVSADGKLGDICAGTGQSDEAGYYLERPKIAGDLHGQAAMLWFCYSLLADYKP
jgi:unsaturated rhamnogalacturonyl hydrolase